MTAIGVTNAGFDFGEAAPSPMVRRRRGSRSGVLRSAFNALRCSRLMGL
jgi:hypothetical protein